MQENHIQRFFHIILSNDWIFACMHDFITKRGVGTKRVQTRLLHLLLDVQVNIADEILLLLRLLPEPVDHMESCTREG